jgi:hypothetical protein
VRSSLPVRAGIGAAAPALDATACASGVGKPAASSSKSPSGMASSSPAMSTTSDSTNTAGAQPYVALDQLLVEHVDLTANVVQTAITKGPSPAGTGAVHPPGIVSSMPAKFTSLAHPDTSRPARLPPTAGWEASTPPGRDATERPAGRSSCFPADRPRAGH